MRQIRAYTLEVAASIRERSRAEFSPLHRIVKATPGWGGAVNRDGEEVPGECDGEGNSRRRSAQRSRGSRDVRTPQNRPQLLAQTEASGASESSYARDVAAPVRRGGAAAACALLAVLAGCGGDPNDAPLALHAVKMRSASCAIAASEVVDYWRRTIANSGLIDEGVGMAMGTQTFVQNQARAAIYDARFRTLFARCKDRLDTDARAAIAEAKASADALCALSADPSGRALLTYASQLSELRSDGERAVSKASTLLSSPINAEKAKDMDLAVEVEAAK